MIVVRFKVRCRPESTEQIKAAMIAMVAPSRAIVGVLHFDVAQDVIDDNALIAVEIFEDRAAMRAQESQAEVAAVVSLIEDGALASEPEWTIYEVNSSSAFSSS